MLTFTLSNLESAARQGDVDEFSDHERSILRWIVGNPKHKDAPEARRRYRSAASALLRCFDRAEVTP